MKEVNVNKTKGNNILDQNKDYSDLNSDGTQYNFHWIADMFPILPQSEIDALSLDIAQNGLLDPIILYNGQILDGRNRYLACIQAGVERRYEEWTGTEIEAISYVWSENFHRRHLSSSQAAACVVMKEGLVGKIEKEFKEKQRAHAGTAPGKKKETVVEIIPQVKRKTRDVLAKSVSTNPHYIQDAKKIKKESPEVLEKVMNGTLNIPEAKKVIKLKPETQEQVFTEIKSGTKPMKAIRKAWDKERSEVPPQPLPEGQYDIIYADPPWKYDYSKSDSRKIENQYPTMELEEIKNLHVPSAKNSILFLWATAPKLEEALEVMESWNFTYKTNMVWDKEVIGMGYYARNQHEILLIGIKGNFSPPHSDNRVSSVYREKRTEHSRKPEYYYGLIESMYPGRKYLELFARENDRDNWTGWGNE